jgi:hypothetical protein
VHAQETVTTTVQRGTRSHRNLNGHKDRTNKRQKTQHVGSFDNNDTQTDGVGGLSDGNDRANPSQESTLRDQSTGGYVVETVISQRPRVRTTDRKYTNTEARGKDSARGRNNTIAYPPHTLQPTGRQNFFHEPVLSEVSQRWGMNTHHLVRPGATHDGEINDEIQETQKPQLVDDRPRFWNIGDRPVFFPANPEWFHLGSWPH